MLEQVPARADAVKVLRVLMQMCLCYQEIVDLAVQQLTKVGRSLTPAPARVEPYQRSCYAMLAMLAHVGCERLSNNCNSCAALPED
jgi:hypothetical protein